METLYTNNQCLLVSMPEVRNIYYTYSHTVPPQKPVRRLSD